ncbi:MULTISPECIES: hypothetical protein [unclassified Micrococcus]|uniref:hypothetical protein n=1 Tax=unclassified Micrococcus TaxID=2620948 RepID=UPI00077DFA54|nr:MULTISPECIES: hypothetical protein [unclassified Micrococcus]KYK00820.1 hypothetical protein AUV02_07600 [Micrococcus sp. CH3]KYK04859.1 hypothetical protein AUV08_01660 [Micrococcus sp. CH7]
MTGRRTPLVTSHADRRRTHGRVSKNELALRPDVDENRANLARFMCRRLAPNVTPTPSKER